MNRLLCSVLSFFLLFSVHSLPAQEHTDATSIPKNELMHSLTSSHEGESTENYFWRMILTLVGIVILLFLTLWLFRRIGRGGLRGKSGNGTSIKVIERRGLSQKSALYLVEIDNKRVLIAESQINIRPLTTFESHIDPHLHEK